MLVVNPVGGPNLADRKPRVISEIRKVNVQRSPSLDGHPKLSGILNYYSEGPGVWTQRTVAVRDGSLLVYESDCSPYEYTPARSYASLGRNMTPIRLPLHSAYFDFKTPLKSGKEQPASFDSPQYFEGKNEGCNSLGRIRGLMGGAEFRLPLRHLNLMPSSLAPRAFCLSYRQNGDAATPVAIFQALSQLEYERWVKTLAVEIMRQTPLEALRFLDVLGIAAISTPTTIPETKQCAKKPHDLTTIRWDRSPSSEGSTTSADFIFRKCGEETPARSKKCNAINQPFTRRKLQMSDVESQSDRDEIDCSHMTSITDVKTNGRRSREKLRRSREGFATNGSSSEDTRAPDEGIVIEERGSSSDRSCRRALWSSDRSDILDSPRSISSYSSYEYGDSPDAADGVVAPNKATIVPSNNAMQLYRAQPFINESSPEPEESERLVKKVEFNAVDCSSAIVSRVDQTTPLIVVDPTQPWEPDAMKGTAWNRARSCSPNNMGSRSPPRFSSSGRGTRALSLGQEYLTVPDAEDNVEVLRQRCQNSDNYVPVKDKLALFESLCRVGRLARSSEELAAIDKTNCAAPRARSLHDLTRSKSPQVPVKEMCKFFEKISNAKPERKPNIKKASLFEKFENRYNNNRDKYLKHKRNDCSNINKDSAFDKTVHRQGEMDENKNVFLDNSDMDSERSKYANFTQIRQGNKIITYV